MRKMLDIHKQIVNLSMDNRLTHSINICTYSSISKSVLPALSKSLQLEYPDLKIDINFDPQGIYTLIDALESHPEYNKLATDIIANLMTYWQDGKSFVGVSAPEFSTPLVGSTATTLFGILSTTTDTTLRGDVASISGL